MFSCFDLLFSLVLEFLLSSRIYWPCAILGVFFACLCQMFFIGGRVCHVSVDLASLY